MLGAGLSRSATTPGRPSGQSTPQYLSDRHIGSIWRGCERHHRTTSLRATIAHVPPVRADMLLQCGAGPCRVPKNKESWFTQPPRLQLAAAPDMQAPRRRPPGGRISSDSHWCTSWLHNPSRVRGAERMQTLTRTVATLLEHGHAGQRGVARALHKNAAADVV